MVSLGGPVILDEDSARFMDRDPENFGALIPKSRMRVEREMTVLRSTEKPVN